MKALLLYPDIVYCAVLRDRCDVLAGMEGEVRSAEPHLLGMICRSTGCCRPPLSYRTCLRPLSMPSAPTSVLSLQWIPQASYWGSLHSCPYYGRAGVIGRLVVDHFSAAGKHVSSLDRQSATDRCTAGDSGGGRRHGARKLSSRPFLRSLFIHCVPCPPYPDGFCGPRSRP
jgi:hypothetical protein